MSTLKRILEFLAALLIGCSIGIATTSGKIAISESWFSVTTLQIALGSVFFSLLVVYIKTDRKDLGPNKLKALVQKTYAITLLLFSVFLWAILARPTIPVNVSFEGVAKTTDVIGTKKDVQKTNENVTQVGATILSFKEKQEKKNDDFSKQLFDLQNKVVELDKDERVRQEAASDQVASVANDLKKVSSGVDDVKNIDHKTPVATTASNVVISEKIRVFGILIIFLLVITSFVTSFSSKVSTKIPVKMTRKIVPLALLILGSILYYFPLLINNMPSISEKKTVPEEVVVRKKEGTVVDTTTLKKEQPQEQQPVVVTQQIPADSVAHKDTAIVTVEIVKPKTKNKKISKLVVTRHKPGKRNFDE